MFMYKPSIRDYRASLARIVRKERAILKFALNFLQCVVCFFASSLFRDGKYRTAEETHMKGFAEFTMDAVKDETLGREFFSLLKGGSEQELFRMLSRKGYQITFEECRRMVAKGFATVDAPPLTLLGAY